MGISLRGNFLRCLCLATLGLHYRSSQHSILSELDLKIVGRGPSTVEDSIIGRRCNRRRHVQILLSEKIDLE